jgi:hypothetical protein
MRRSGQTTREVDAVIQRLFRAGSVEVEDHHGSYAADRHQFELVLKRLASEHPHQRLCIDRSRYTIKLVPAQPSITDMIRPYQELISHCQREMDRIIQHHEPQREERIFIKYESKLFL